MQYLAALGRERSLSLAELEATLGAGAIEPQGDCAVLSKPVDLQQYGSLIKIGRLAGRQPIDQPFDLVHLVADLLPGHTTKFNLGLSFYGRRLGPKQIARSALDLKRRLNRSLRIVLPQSGQTLSAAQVKFNRLIQPGLEIMISQTATEFIWAVTEQVQDIDWYSRRDYGRPARRARIGMLPPKLAQIMINLGGAGAVYDPFCGVGTVLAEALLLGRPAFGSDLNPDRISDSRQNLDWLEEIKPGLPAWKLWEADSRGANLPPQSQIVTEGYLGPPNPSPANSHRLQTELSDLYQESLSNWSRQQATGQTVVICLPSWQGQSALPVLDQIDNLGYNVVKFTHPDQPPWLYQRPAQQVGRQILVLRKT